MSVYRQNMEFKTAGYRKIGKQYEWFTGYYSAGIQKYTVTDLTPGGYGTYTETEIRRCISQSLPSLELPIDTFVSAIIHLDVSKYYEGDHESLYVDVLSSDYTNADLSVIWAATGDRVGTITVYKNGGGELNLTKAQAENAIKYGIKLQNTNETTKSLIGGGEAYLEIIYKSNQAKPDISLTDTTSENGWTITEKTAEVDKAIEKAFDVPLAYTQENGQANAGYTVTRERYAGADENGYIWGEPETVMTDAAATNGVLTIPPSVWRGVEHPAPAAFGGNDGLAYNYIRLQIRAKSAAGVYSEPLVIRTKNRLRELAITKPARDSVQIANSAIQIGWTLEDKTYLSSPSSLNMQVSYDGGALWETAIEDIQATAATYTIASETLKAGAVRWRLVQKYLGGTIVQPQVGARAESRLVARGNPTTSTVTCDGKPQPKVSWQSAEQKSYQVRLGDYDSGAVYSTAKSHVVPRFFADGNYPVQVRTQVASGEWSDWTPVLYVSIANVAPEDVVTLQTPVMDGGAAKLTWYTMYKNRFARYILYRNGVAIYDTDGAANIAGYMDKTAIGVCTYYVRGVTTGRYYAQSDTVTIDTTPTTDLLYDEAADEYIRLRYTVSAPTTVTYLRQVGVSYQYFAGRAAPVAIVNGRTERSTTQTYGSKTRELVDKVGGMVGKTVLFKDTRGGGIYGVIESAQCTHGRIHSVTFTVREVDKNERIEYTVPTA